jgi:beta-mannosidase
VDFFLRPKLAWYAIKRELRPINVAISRSVKQADDTSRQGPVGQDPGAAVFDIWGANATLVSVDVDLSVECFDITTGKKIWKLENMVRTLPPNQSTPLSLPLNFPADYDFSNMVISVSFTTLKSSDDPSQETMSSHTIRSSANWPQPLKYLDLGDRHVTFSVNAEEIIIQAEKPMKSVVLDVEGDDDSNLEWTDNGFDIMPGEIVKVMAKGLRGRKVVVR